ncbi:MAG: S41 family peptidase [Candidatus Kapabacteria bacterium]|nr:S41 family peptidase [Candidatus Kapabacteria bacterium]
MKFFQSSLTIVLLITLGLVLGSSNDSYYSKVNESIDRFTTIFKEISLNYVDEIEPDRFVQNGIDAMLKSLDPYTVYFDEEENQDFSLLQSNSYVGLGLSLATRDSMLTIIGVYEGGVSERKGLLVGDKIYKIDTVVTLFKNSDDVRSLTRGPVNSVVDLTVIRNANRDTITITLQRESIVIKSVPFYTILDNSIGYIQLTRFSSSSYKEVKDALVELKKEKTLSGIILDLRGNPGGLLESSISILELFVPKGSTVVSTKGRFANSARTYTSTIDPIDGETPMTVLINNESASASEIVAGAIQDLDRGIVLGQTSFGKGLVQTVVPISRKGALKLTTSKYFTPSGRSLQKINYFVHENDLKDDKTIPAKEFRTINNRVVKEENGITPDSIIKQNEYSPYVLSLLNSNLIFTFISDEYPLLLEKFNKNFSSAELFSSFEKYLIKKGYKYKSSMADLLEVISFKAKHEKHSKTIVNTINDLEKMIQKESTSLIKAHQSDVQYLLEREIASRKMNKKDYYIYSFQKDNDIETAIKLLLSKKQYKQFLSSK